jgi:hypothetical protein
VGEEVFDLRFGRYVHIQHDDLVAIEREFVLLHGYSLPKLYNLTFYYVGKLAKRRQFLDRCVAMRNLVQDI